jgi:hypothetical protein
MTMMTHTSGPVQRTPSPSASQAPFEARAAATDLTEAELAARRAAHRAMIGQFCRVGLTILLAGGALAGIIALKTVVYFLRYNYY